MKKILLYILLTVSIQILAQSQDITGTVKDSKTNEPVVGANISIKGKLIGTTSDASGNFALKTSSAPPFILVVSVIGFQRQEIDVTSAGQALAIGLIQKNELMDEMVISASRVEENILKSPVSIEKMDQKAIRETPSINFYDGLQNIKSVEMALGPLECE